MLNQLAHLLGRVVVPLFEGVSTNSWRSLPSPPSGRTICRGPGHDPDRVLLLGASSAVGWGVVDHDLGLAGHLARATSALTERGVDVEVIADARMTVPEAIAALSASTISRYDAIVLTLGSREALQLMPAKRWATQLTRLLDHIGEGRDVRPSIVVVGAEEREPVPLPGLAAAAVRNRAQAINAASRQLIATRHGVRFVASGMGPGPGESPNLVEADKNRMYERAGAAIAPVLAGLLEGAGGRLPHPLNEEGRLRAVRHLRSRLDRDDERIAALLTTVKHVLHVRSVDLFFVDRVEVRLIGATSEAPSRRARDETLSSEAIEHRGGYVVPDLAAHERHRHRPEVAGPPHLRFYASYPVESPDGHPVAVLTVVDTVPRELSLSELGLLRHFALRIGALLFEEYRATP